MGRLIDDEVLHTIAACGTPKQIAAHIRERVDGVSDTVCLYQPRPIAVNTFAAIVDELRSPTAAAKSVIPLRKGT